MCRRWISDTSRKFTVMARLPSLDLINEPRPNEAVKSRLQTHNPRPAPPLPSFFINHIPLRAPLPPPTGLYAEAEVMPRSPDSGQLDLSEVFLRVQ